MSTVIATPGQQGTDDLALFLKVFGGETLAAFERTSVTLGRHMIRTISSGKSAQFPVFGRTTAKYLKPGNSLDDQREKTQQDEVIISIDGLLTADSMLHDLDDAMAHFDVSSEYTRQQGEALAISLDGSVLAEMAKLAFAKKENIIGLGKSDVLERSIAGADYGATAQMGLLVYQMLLDIAVKLDYNKVPQADRTAYVKPEGHRSLAASLVALNRDYGAQASITEANVIRIAGFDVVPCAHLTDGGPDKEGSVQGSGHIFPATLKGDAMMVVAHRTSVGTVKLKELSVEHARRPEYQADEIISKLAVGHGGLRPEATFLGVIKKS